MMAPGPWLHRRPPPQVAHPSPVPGSSGHGPRQQQHSQQPSDDFVTRLHNISPIAPPERLAHLPNFASLDNLNPQANADSSSSESDLHPSRPRRPTHSRSLSHPFPSFFSSSKKKRPANPNCGASDSSSDNDNTHVTRQQPKSHKRGNMSGGGGVGGMGGSGSRDFATGNCMTCNSLVRWPRDLKVFKCTVCVTINDLSPFDRPDIRSDTVPRWLRRPSHGQASQASPKPSSPPKPTARPVDSTESRGMSVEHTKALVEQCLRAFLSRRLAGNDTNDQTQPEFTTAPTTESPALDVQTPDLLVTPSQPEPTSPPNTYAPNGRPTKYIFHDQSTLHPDPPRASAATRSYSSSYPSRPPSLKVIVPDETQKLRPSPVAVCASEAEKRIYKPLEDYIVSCFSSFHCVNSSFLTRRPSPATHSNGESARRPSTITRQETRNVESPICDLDPKLLLLGDFVENGMWWTGDQKDEQEHKKPETRRATRTTPSFVSSRSAQMEWEQVATWYATVINSAQTWPSIYAEFCRDGSSQPLSTSELEDLERALLTAQDRVQRVLLKATEMLLKRPGRPMNEPDDLRYLLIILENPLLHANPQLFRGTHQHHSSIHQPARDASKTGEPAPRGGPVAGQHSGILKRIMGLISNASNASQTYLIAWLAWYSEQRFFRIKDLVGGFLTYRLIRQNEKKHEAKIDLTGGLIPNMGRGNSAASLYAALGTPGPSRKAKTQPQKMVYHDDWQVRAAARVMALLFAANNTVNVRRADTSVLADSRVMHRQGVQVHGQLLPRSDFYNTMIDYADLIADFEAWEAKRGNFTFCQYPFLLSIWAKSQILEHDARRQMMTKARDAFFDSIMTRKTVTQYLTLDIRRDCLVEDSLTAVSEVIGSGSEDIKKRLRIVFKGEEGYDAGGLRKEWFLLLVREVFNPDHGMFIYNEDSLLCYFNPNSFETSDQFFLVGVVLGLAIYNSTILDVALPPFAYRKLLASAPMSSALSSAHPRPAMSYSLEDLAEYRPRLASGLKQLLVYEGDVETTFLLDFVVPMEKYGTVLQVPLCHGGDKKPVTNANRKEFVELYVRYLLETAVARQFEPFKRGFYTVCGGNALSLFRPEEIELLVRGSDAALDIDSLQAVAEYDNWGAGNRQPEETEPVVSWFWETFREASPKDQRKLLLFITGSDRIPATGAASLPIKISCLGDDEDRYPIARTCFNMLALRRYTTRERLQRMLWTAVHESEGFGLK